MRRNPVYLVEDLVVGLIGLFAVVVLAGTFLLANPILILVVLAVGYGAYRLFKKPKQD
jgi:hypothetical protein